MIVSVPTGSMEVLHEAWPPLSVILAKILVDESTKITDPVGDPEPDAVTWAVKVTDCPKTVGLTELASDVVVATRLDPAPEPPPVPPPPKFPPELPPPPPQPQRVNDTRYRKRKQTVVNLLMESSRHRSPATLTSRFVTFCFTPIGIASKYRAKAIYR
jgi:hypothetical protein